MFFFYVKVDSQAPRRAVQCLLAYKLTHLEAEVQSQLDGPPKRREHQLAKHAEESKLAYNILKIRHQNTNKLLTQGTNK